jgi:hypothetical protein
MTHCRSKDRKPYRIGLITLPLSDATDIARNSWPYSPWRELFPDVFVAWLPAAEVRRQAVGRGGNPRDHRTGRLDPGVPRQRVQSLDAFGGPDLSKNLVHRAPLGGALQGELAGAAHRSGGDRDLAELSYAILSDPGGMVRGGEKQGVEPPGAEAKRRFDVALEISGIGHHARLDRRLQTM